VADHLHTHVTTRQLDQAIEVLGLTPAPGTHLIRLEITAGKITADYAAVRRITSEDYAEEKRDG
jgi:hypothetical protein